MANINFQGHWISFHNFIGKNNKFQGCQGQLFKIKGFQGFRGLLTTLGACLAI